MVLLDYLVTKFPTAKKTTLRRMIEAGRVRINGLSAKRAKDPVAEGDRVEVVDEVPVDPGAARQAIQAARPPFEILFEDDEVVVILKPPGLITSGGPGEKRATAAKKLEAYFAAQDDRWRVGVIHRLDRDASGLLVFTKTTAAYHHLKAQFFHHTVDRQYTAVVAGVLSPRTGTIESRLTERNDGRVMIAEEYGEGQEAVTEYATVSTAKYAPAGGKTISLLKVTLRTGRKHQIRVHMAAKGCPILGDPVYGVEERPRERLMLAATRLAFDHPRTGERKVFEIKPPKEVGGIFGG